MSLATSLENKIRANKKVVDMTWLTGEKGIGKIQFVGFPPGTWSQDSITFPYQHTPSPYQSVTDMPEGTVLDLTKLFPNPTVATNSEGTYEFKYWWWASDSEKKPITSWTVPVYVEGDLSTYGRFVAQWEKIE